MLKEYKQRKGEQMTQINVARDQAKIRADTKLALEELELRAQAQASSSPNFYPTPQNRDAESPKLKTLVDGINELNSYLDSFERYARNANWEKDTWAIKLCALPSGRSMDLYIRMSNEDANDYDKLKKAHLTRDNFMKHGYRWRFKEVKPETKETPDQFLIRLKNYLAKC